ncbi:MAG: hypothetical protein RIM72_10845 [Alphaproteobacteria bacterium]
MIGFYKNIRNGHNSAQQSGGPKIVAAPLALMMAGMLLAGCDAVWPSTSAPDPVAPQTASQSSGSEQYSTASSQSEPGAVSTTSSSSAASSPSVQASATAQLSQAETGIGQTFVGKKVDAMGQDLNKLLDNISVLKDRATSLRNVAQVSADNYHALLASITARLQQGTTPGNPVLVAQWNDAQSELEKIANNVPQMTVLSNDAADEAAFGQYLLNAVQATYGLSGAVESDHVRLRRLEDDVHQAVVLVDRMLNDLSQDINRQNTYVSNERQNLTTLSLAVKNGELYGTSLATRAFTQTENTARAAARASQPQPSDRPLVIIRFDRPNVPYQQALYNAVSQALSRKPTATFDLVAVSPDVGTAAQIALNSAASKRNAEDVLRTLTDMGVPASRVQLLAATDSSAQTNEVHLFVR